MLRLSFIISLENKELGKNDFISFINNTMASQMEKIETLCDNLSAVNINLNYIYVGCYSDPKLFYSLS